MDCRNCQPPPANQGPINYDQCLHTLGNHKDATGFLNALCRSLNGSTNGGQKNSAGSGTDQPQPGIQCVVVPVRSLCLEISLYHLDNDLLKRVILCTFSGMFQRTGPGLYRQVYDQYATFLRTEPGIDLASFSGLFLESLRQLYHTYRNFSGCARDFYYFLTSPEELAQIADCDSDDLPGQNRLLVAYLTKQKFLEELAKEFTKMEYALCQKFLRMEIDIVILSARITELATNTKGGISGITEALLRVAIGDANRYFEEKDFKDLFHPAEDVADVIQKLSCLYRKRFKIFAELSKTFICSRPQPPVKTIISEIPTAPPTVIV